MINIKEIIIKEKEELPKDINNARSIGAYNQPDNPVYIGSLKTKWNTYHYFTDGDSDFYYESERTMRFDEEMQEAKKERKRYSKK